MTDPKRWLDEERSPLGALARAGAEERPSATAKHRAKAAVLLAAAGGAASGLTQTAAASTAATASTPPVSLAATTYAASGSAVGAATSGATAATAASGGAVVTGAAGLASKFGASSVLLAVIAKWTGLGAVVAAVGVGGYQLTSNVAPPSGAIATTASSLTASSLTASSLAAPVLAPTNATAVIASVTAPRDAAFTAPGSAHDAFVSPTSTGLSASMAAETSHSAPLVVAPRPDRAAKTAHVASTLSTLARNRELELVDRSWAALRDGRPHEALRLIDTYPWGAEERQFEVEALLIRLEALERSGQHQKARSLAARVLRTHERGRLADKARQLLTQ